MDPMKILQLLAAQGSAPTLPHTPIPPQPSPVTEPPPDEAKADEGLSEMEKLMRAMQAQQTAPRGASGGAASLNPFYNPSSPGIGSETFTKMAASMGGK